MDSLPTEILERIFRLFDNPFEILPLASVCRRWREVVQHDNALFQPMAKNLSPLMQMEFDEPKLLTQYGNWFNQCLRYTLEQYSLDRGFYIDEQDFEQCIANVMPSDFEAVHSIGQCPIMRNELSREGTVITEVYHPEGIIDRDPEDFLGVGVIDVNALTYSFIPCKMEDLLSGGYENDTFYFESRIPGSPKLRWSFPSSLLGNSFQLLASTFSHFTFTIQDDEGNINTVARVRSNRTNSSYPEFMWRCKIDSRSIVLVSVQCIVTILDNVVSLYSIPSCELLASKLFNMPDNSSQNDSLPHMYQSQDWSICENHLLFFNSTSNTLHACPFTSLLNDQPGQLQWKAVVTLKGHSDIVWGKFSHYWTKQFLYITGARPGASYLCLINMVNCTCKVYYVTKHQVDAQYPKDDLADDALDDSLSYRGGFWFVNRQGSVTHITGKTNDALYKRYAEMSKEGSIGLVGKFIQYK